MADLLWCAETYVHVENMGKDNEKRTGLGGGEPYETFTDNVGTLYRACMKEHGRPISKLYVGDGKQVGWVFLKRNPPEPEGDGKGVIETWITVWDKPPRKRVVWSKGTHPSFQRPKKEKKATLSSMPGGGMRLTPDYK